MPIPEKGCRCAEQRSCRVHAIYLPRAEQIERDLQSGVFRADGKRATNWRTIREAISLGEARQHPSNE
jgi:hypothetical protein